jgi:hypothetical protein
MKRRNRMVAMCAIVSATAWLAVGCSGSSETNASSHSGAGSSSGGGSNGSSGDDAGSQCTPPTGTWTSTGSMTTARSGHAALRLRDGGVLVVGGSGLYTAGPLASAEIYDPTAGTWTSTGSTAASRSAPVLLPDGRVLVEGGFNNGSNPVASAEIYDPTTGSWTITGSMAYRRNWHSATLMSNGKVLVAGGNACPAAGGSCTGKYAEVYDPATETWTSTGSLNSDHASHMAVPLPDGRVLVVGGHTPGTGSWQAGFTSTASAELYDPTTGAWTATGSMTTAREGTTAVLLQDGRVLVPGGAKCDYTISSNPPAPPLVSETCRPLASVEVYDAATGSWATTGSLTSERDQLAVTLLCDGRVLAAGGFRCPTGSTFCNPGSSTSEFLASAEVYDPSSGSWTVTGSMSAPTSACPAVQLMNGRVLVAGGSAGYSTATFVATAELY